MRKFELIEHTADIGIRVFGKNEKELFENAALGMFEIIADLKNIVPNTKEAISLNAQNKEELLVNWLSELLSRYDAYEMLFSEFSIKQISQTNLEAEIAGQRLNNNNLHRIKTEIKAVTFHELKFKKTDSGWQAEIIFDV